MCTVSWRVSREGYDLFFNRDELNTRAPEVAPAIGQSEGVAFLAPRDGTSGGTWLLANDRGLTLGLLNDYGASWRPAAAVVRVSRGQIVLAAAAAANHAALIEIVGRQPLARTPAFQLVALSREEGAMVLRWDGAALTWLVASAPLTSSSYATAEVIATRVRRYHETVRSGDSPDISELFAYHRQHEQPDGAYSVLMHRPDAATRSITHVTVKSDQVTMLYEAVRWAPRKPVFLKPVLNTLPLRLCSTLSA